MQIAGSSALVTGANRGLGRHLAQQLLERGAKVYAGARSLDSLDLPGAIPVQLDVTDPQSVFAATEVVRGVSLLVNNAGSSTRASLLGGSLEDIRLEMDTHYFGALLTARAFAPQLKAADEGGILNILSVLSWLTSPELSAYSAAKSAEWSLTNALRLELAAGGVQVTGLHVGYMNTDMARDVDAPKHDPADIARLALDGIEGGEVEIVADELSAEVKAGLAVGPVALYPQLA